MNHLIIEKSPIDGRPIVSVSQFSVSSVPYPEYSNDESSFLGLFEGKLKAKRAANNSSEDEASSVSTSGKSGNFGNVLSGVLSVGANLISILPALGVGSKSRMKEIQAQNDADAKLLAVQNQSEQENEQKTQTMILIGGAIVFAILIVIILSLRK